MSNSINQEKLKKYTNAYFIYELATNGVDLRDSLDGTTLRMKGQTGEGYKYDVYDNFHKNLETKKSYVDLFLENFPGVNLASYHQRQNIEDLIKAKGKEPLEATLRAVYEGTDDANAFHKIVDLLGGYFDILGFIFFLKDYKKYMPIRSRLFDARFDLLDLDSDLAGNCNWEKYQEYNSWIQEIQGFLQENVNKDITLLDAHSFVWMLPRVKDYLDQNVQIVEHKKYGKGVVVGLEKDLILVEFGQQIKRFKKDTAFTDEVLKVVPIDYNIYGGDDKTDESDDNEEAPLSKKAVEVGEALLKLIVNRQRLTTYGELSEMTDSKPSAYYEMRMLLDDINKRCDKLGLPYISAMVVNKETGLPGKGFREICINSFGYDPALTTQEIFKKELDKIGKCDEWNKLADYLGIEMPVEDEEPLPEEVREDQDKPIIEGAKKTITVISYERDQKAVKKCKDYYMKRDGRVICQICGFDFGEKYGVEYANKIHVHHVKPISEIGEEYIVDPVRDLIPVCPNCHMVLHIGNGISVEELRERLRKNSSDIE